MSGIGNSEELADRSSFWPTAWIVAFILNLPLPFLFGLSFTERGGFWGMMAATALIGIVGFVLCRHSTSVAQVLVIGSAIVAPSQVLFMVHFIVGDMALQAVKSPGMWVGGTTEKLTVLGGFTATLLTAAPFLVGAAMIGLVVRMVGHWNR